MSKDKKVRNPKCQYSYSGNASLSGLVDNEAVRVAALAGDLSSVLTTWFPTTYSSSFRGSGSGVLFWPLRAQVCMDTHAHAHTCVHTHARGGVSVMVLVFKDRISWLSSL